MCLSLSCLVFLSRIMSLPLVNHTSTGSMCNRWAVHAHKTMWDYQLWKQRNLLCYWNMGIGSSFLQPIYNEAAGCFHVCYSQNCRLLGVMHLTLLSSKSISRCLVGLSCYLVWHGWLEALFCKILDFFDVQLNILILMCVIPVVLMRYVTIKRSVCIQHFSMVI